MYEKRAYDVKNRKIKIIRGIVGMLNLLKAAMGLKDSSTQETQI